MDGTVVVRPATNADLPRLWQLILDSFLALVEHTDESLRAMFEQTAVGLREQDLKDVEASYQAVPDTHFWVAEHSQHGVIGCVALKRSNADDAELVRMAVDPACRGARVGERLMATLRAYAVEHGYLRVTLVTGNPRAASFYKKMGFVSFSESTWSMPPPSQKTGTKFCMVLYLGDKLIRHVAIVGGTHGNERIGVVLAQLWQQNPAPVQRSTFKTSVVLANEEAAKRNVRYVDTDLNRCFTAAALSSGGQTHEAQVAAALDGKLGPKRADGFDCTCDFIIDLHSTTSNMGLSLVMTADGDPFACRVAHALLGSTPELKLTGAPGGKSDCWSVDSLAPSGLAIEVGPLAHGTLSQTLLEGTKQLISGALDYIEQHNAALLKLAAEGALQCKLRERSVVFSPAVARPVPSPVIPFYERVGTLSFPRAASGELAGLISKAIDGHDWSPVASSGDGLFVDFDGNPLPCTLPVVPFHGPAFVVAPQPQLYAIFVNEASYFEKGLAMVLCQKVDKFVY